MRDVIIAIDQGTTSTRVIAFDLEGMPVATHQIELAQHYPAPAHVEHDAEEIFKAVVTCCEKVVTACQENALSPIAMGITNQRETSVLWDRRSGKAMAPAIVWQDRRTHGACKSLQDSGHATNIRKQTGLLLDPYFSATKMQWLLDQNPDLRRRAARGELCLGTIDSWLLFRLSGGAHYTDATNAARTMLCDIRTGQWSSELCALFDIPSASLPEITDCAGQFGTSDAALFGASIPITGMIGDQQAASVGQGCSKPGAIKSTYGTGCFLLQNTGGDLVTSDNRLLGTIAYKLDGKISYALEGSIFSAGAGVQWLRDGLGLISSAEDSEAAALRTDSNGGVYMVPAFTGLGAPYWDANARGMIVGLDRSASADHIIRATLESVAYQTHDLLVAMAEDGTPPPSLLRVDGGMVANDWFTSFLADILNLEIDRPRVIETTALGAAIMAGIGAGVFQSLEDGERLWQLDRIFKPRISHDERVELLTGWKHAVARCLMQN